MRCDAMRCDTTRLYSDTNGVWERGVGRSMLVHILGDISILFLSFFVSLCFMCHVFVHSLFPIYSFYTLTFFVTLHLLLHLFLPLPRFKAKPQLLHRPNTSPPLP
jgi:hypothetical protein